jgi:hypothetical protein
LLVSRKFRNETFPCRLRTISEIVDEEGVERIDLLKLDVERSEGEVLAGIRSEHWGRIGQAVIEVHDEKGGLKEVERLLTQHQFEVTVEQDPQLKGTPLFTVFASRKH